MSAKLLLTLMACIPLSWAFLDTFPLVAFSSLRTPVLESLYNSLVEANRDEPPWTALLDERQICDFDAVVLVEQPGLHAFDLRTLPPSSSLSNKLKSSPQSFQFPYVRRTSPIPMLEVAQSLARHCGAKVVKVERQIDVDLDSSSKHVICLHLPAVRGGGRWRKEVVTAHQSVLADDLAKIEALFPLNMVIYIGGPGSPFDKRQEPTEFDNAILPPFTFAPNGTSPVLTEGGIFKRYQLLTPGLIVALLLVVFVLLPILFLGITALASIQSSIRFTAPKITGQDKKNL